MAIVRRHLGQFDILSLIPTAVSAAASIGTAIYQGGVAQDVAQIQADAAIRSAQINAAVKQLEIEKLSSLQSSLQTSPSALDTTLTAGFPTWAWFLLAGMGVFMIFGRRR